MTIADYLFDLMERCELEATHAARTVWYAYNSGKISYSTYALAWRTSLAYSNHELLRCEFHSSEQEGV